MKAHMDHQPEDNLEETTLTRRNFLKMGVGALSALAALEIGGASLLFLKSRSQEGKFGGEFILGEPDAFPNNSVTEYADGNFFLIRTQEGGFLSVYRRCPHLGCTVEWVEAKQRFYCPCHASSFDMHGDFISQPVPRALDTFEVKIEDGQVVVDTSKITQRERFSPDQLIYG